MPKGLQRTCTKYTVPGFRPARRHEVWLLTSSTTWAARVGKGQRPGRDQTRDGPGGGRHLPIHAILHAVADLVLGLEEEVLEGRRGNPAHAQLVLKSPNTAHVYVRRGISGHCGAGWGRAGLSQGLLRPGWPLSGFKSQSTWLRWHLLPFSPLPLSPWRPGGLH